jgi:DNA-binding transcriptional regulator YiaG
VTPSELILLADARAHARDGTGRTIRQNADLSIAEVAATIGTNRGGLSRWERGEAAPHGPAAISWAALLHTLKNRQHARTGEAA